MKRLAVAGLLVLAGCDQLQSHSEAKPGPPVSRYQMTYDATGGGVYVLDTQTGSVAHCWTNMSNATWCNQRVDSDAMAQLNQSAVKP